MRQLTWLFGLPVSLWCAALALILWRARVVFVLAPADTAVFLAALRARLERNDLDAAHELARRALPTWIARVTNAALSSWRDRATLHAAVEDLIAELELDLTHYVLAVRTLGRVAPPVAFTCAIVQLSTDVRHELGLLALQRGLAQSVAIERAMLCIVTGLATTLLCRVGARLLQQQERALHADLTRTAELLFAAAADSAE